MKNKKILISLLVIISLCLVATIVIFANTMGKKSENKMVSQSEEVVEEQVVVELENEEKEEKKKEVQIVNENTSTRPYAVVINNTPVAVKVQTGLNKAYLVYEIPTEGNTSRLMALYRDVDEDFTIGTIRSSRHDFIDYALESNAIFVHYGWSHYAETEQKKGVIDYINGLFGGPFWRNNPENLASEHTAYTSISKLKEEINNRKLKTTGNNTILLNYSIENIDLKEKDKSQVANKVKVQYDSGKNITSFVYNEQTKMYDRYENNTKCIDYQTKEQVDTKNIIVQKVSYKVCSDNKYWDLQTTGTGKGYFITNGYAVPITWSKKDRNSQTKYYYEDGSEISVNDGRTYIELQTTSQQLKLEN